MIISNLIEGTFLERPNRFTVIFKRGGALNEELNGTDSDPEASNSKAHLRDPGRLEELLFTGAHLLLRPALNPEGRKTAFDVVAVFKDGNWVLINSGFHSDIAQELIESGLINELSGYSVERREYKYGKSRIDFFLSANASNTNVSNYVTDNDNIKNMLLEVKGCTLVENGHARFPDAPTTRGRKHVEELRGAMDEGYRSLVLFLILKEDAVDFAPNRVTDPDFSDSLTAARDSGVLIVPYSFKNIYDPSNRELRIKPFKRVGMSF